MPRPTRIFAGMQHGHLTVVREIEQRKNGRKFFECRCECGKTVAIRSSHFYPERQHCSQQCSFLASKRVVDLTGQRFERWLVLSPAGICDTTGWAMWNCRCDCGMERTAAGAQLTAGLTRSCGCLGRDMRATGRTPEEEKAVRRERSRLSARKNPARMKANKIKYEKKLAKATPDWLTPEDWTAMNAVYEEARRLTRETGTPHQVDHIFPINGKTVSGLHVPSNLQILTKAANVAKSNRYAELSGD
jgi:hypothetical protein